MCRPDAAVETGRDFILCDIGQSVIQFLCETEFTGVAVGIIFVVPGKKERDQDGRNVDDIIDKRYYDGHGPGVQS